MHFVVSQNKGYPIGSPHNKDYNILGSILGSPYLGKLSFPQSVFKHDSTQLKGKFQHSAETTPKTMTYRLTVTCNNTPTILVTMITIIVAIVVTIVASNVAITSSILVTVFTVITPNKPKSHAWGIKV